MWETLLPLFGFFIGIIASLTGVGGGIFIVPVLTILYAFSPITAIATSLTTIIFTSAASTLNYARQRRIYYKTGIALAITTAPGAILGAKLADMMDHVDKNLLGFVFGFFLILIGMRMLIDFNSIRRSKAAQSAEAQQTKSDDELISSTKTILWGAGLSFFGGVASGMLGIGGGVLVVPIMAFTMAMPIHFATATSMFTMIFTSISGVAEHYVNNRIDFQFALLLALGTIFGAQVGAYTSKKISSKNLRKIFAVMLIIAAIKMIDQYKVVLGLF
jgi:uncharacterized membrane protein YfcA